MQPAVDILLRLGERKESRGQKSALLRPYLLKMLKHQSMPKRKLAADTQSITISRILYALVAWSGFLNAEMINRITAFLNVLSGLA